ncbi:MAG: MFS transporter [Candidatus Krumholzibacteria bacterium]|nr:MFS transporter [Candidatus Krumholzibacteria bacterium]
MTDPQTDRQDRDSFQSGKVVTISAAHLSHDVFSSFLAPLLPLLIAKLNLSLSAVAILDIARKIPQLLNPLIGLMADRICVKYFVILAPAVTAACMSLLGVAPSSSILLVLLFLSGLSAAVFHVPGPVLIKRYSGSNSGRGMSYYMFGGEMARTLGPLLITAAVSWWGLEGSYRVLPIGLAASVLMFFRLRNLQAVEGRPDRKFWQGSRSALREVAPLFAGLAGYMVFRMGLKSALTLYLPTYLTAQGETLWMASGALSLLQFSGAVGTFGAGFFADRFGHRSSLLLIAVLTPLAGLGLTFLPGILTIPLLILTGFLIFASSPIQLAMVQDMGTSRPAFLNSLFMTLNIVSSALAVLFVGTLGDRLGLDLTFKISAGLTVLAIPFVLLFPPREHSG